MLSQRQKRVVWTERAQLSVPILRTAIHTQQSDQDHSMKKLQLLAFTFGFVLVFASSQAAQSATPGYLLPGPTDVQQLPVVPPTQRHRNPKLLLVCASCEPESRLSEPDIAARRWPATIAVCRTGSCTRIGHATTTTRYHGNRATIGSRSIW